MTRKILIILSAYLFVLSFAFAESENPFTTIILVRHAEKSTTPKDDPVLSDAGKARAAHLAEMLRATGVTAIYTTNLQRTGLTAEPLAKQLSISPTVFDAKDSSVFSKAIRDKNAGQTVLVVGHSNTVPEIIHGLGGPAMDEIDETEYDNLFIVTMPKDGKSSVLKLKY
jgi:broad specificity phosphatase PhoE